MSWKNIISALLIAISLSSIPTIALAGDLAIGTRCVDDVECASQNCEESDLPKEAGASNRPSFCVCSSADDCEKAYTGTDWKCGDTGVLSGAGQISHFGVNYCYKPGYFQRGFPDAEIAKYKPIGATCTKDEECLTNDCQSSDLTNEPKFCACNADYHCVYTYKTTGQGEEWDCKGDTKISHGIDFCESTVRGAQMPIQSKDLIQGVTDAEDAKKPQDYNSIPPKITIPIPNLPSFVSTKIKAGDTITFPWIGEYMLAVINYMVAIGALLAVVSLAAGGILYIAGGANPSMVSKAKGVMWGSLTGTILLICSYMILYIVNPRLTDFPNLAVETVKPEELSSDIDAAIIAAEAEEPETPLPKATAGSVASKTLCRGIPNCKPVCLAMGCGTIDNKTNCNYDLMDKQGIGIPQLIPKSQWPKFVNIKANGNIKATPQIIEGLKRLDTYLSDPKQTYGGKGYSIKITNCWRDWRGDTSKECSRVLRDVSPIATGMAWPGSSPHSSGAACDVVLTRNQQELTGFGSTQACKSKKPYNEILNAIMTNSFVGAWRLNYEIWHFEWGGKQGSSRCQGAKCDAIWPPKNPGSGTPKTDC